MLDKVQSTEPKLGAPADDATTRDIERFLYREARLLDREAYAEWFELLAPDIHYWMPGIETRRRDDARSAYRAGDMAYFDDDLEMLRIRIARFAEPTAWADNPATRHVHQITNIEAFETDDADLVAAFSVFTNVRNRNLKDQDLLYGRREDLLRRDGDGAFRLVRRHILVVQDVLLSKNINTFL